jgi:hypothetical protein
MNGNPAVIREAGFRALMQSLGAAGTARFLRQLESGNGNYTEERAALHENVAIDDIVTRINRRKELRPAE